MPWRQLRLGCHPPGLFDRLKALPGFNPRELLDMELEIKAIEGCPDDEYADWVELHITREQRWFEIARYPDARGARRPGRRAVRRGRQAAAPLLALHRPGLPPGASVALGARDDRALRAVLPHARRAHRRARRASPARTATVVLASDHGFGPTRDVFHVNSWLEREGYLAWADAQNGAADGDTQVGFAEVTRHVHALDWEQTLAYAATPSSQGINIVSRVPGSDDAAARGRAIEDRRRAGRGAAGRPAPTRRPAARGRGVDARGGVRGAVRRDRPRPIARAGGWRHDLDPSVGDAGRPPPAAARSPPLGGHLHRERGRDP